MSVYKRLEELQITLPEPVARAASYVPYVRRQKLLFLAGHVARIDGRPWVGKLGDNLTTAEGNSAAHAVAIDLMGTLQAAVGDLDRVEQIIKLTVYVNSTADFTEQHLVANGASDLLRQAFGDVGLHTRSAFGVAQVPFGSCVEIELIAEVGD